MTNTVNKAMLSVAKKEMLTHIGNPNQIVWPNSCGRYQGIAAANKIT